MLIWVRLCEEMHMGSLPVIGTSRRIGLFLLAALAASVAALCLLPTTRLDEASQPEGAVAYAKPTAFQSRDESIHLPITTKIGDSAARADTEESILYESETTVADPATADTSSALRGSETSETIPQRGSYSGGSGTEDDPYRIATKADLLELAANTGDYGQHFLLTADIDLAGETYTTALIAPDTSTHNSGFQGTSFTGTFDGNGHIVRALAITPQVLGQHYLGLFGYLGPGALVANLEVTDVLIAGHFPCDYVGGLCGYNNGGTLSICQVSASVVWSNAGMQYIGGLCGANYQGTISGCHAILTATVGIGARRVGGLCGTNLNGTIGNSSSTGSITSRYASDFLGGLCGYSSGTIGGCYANAAVSASDRCTHVGGLCGHNQGTIAECYATGSVASGEDTEYLGGLTGRNSGVISDCYAIGTVTCDSPSSSVGALCGNTEASLPADCYFYLLGGPDNGLGTPLDTALLKDKASFGGFDFGDSPGDGTHDTWSITPEHCPRLAWQKDEGPLAPAAPVTALAGSGTATSPFSIASAEDFAEFRSNTGLTGGYYSLTCDIDLTGETFVAAPIRRVFGGVLAGNGHTIRNLTIWMRDQDYVGLFASVCGEVRDLVVENVQISIDGSHYAGGVCGYNSGVIAGCHATGSITAGTQSGYVGGLCGYNDHGTVTACHAAVSVTGDGYAYCFGGLCGYNNYGTASESHATGNVTADDYAYFVGGFCGSSDNGSIASCYASGSVTSGYSAYYVAGFCGKVLSGNITDCCSHGAVASGKSWYVGGFCGLDDHGIVEHSYATGAVTSDAAASYVGGFCGYNNAGTIGGCFWDTNTSGMTTSRGGTGKTTAAMQAQATFAAAGWDLVGETANGTNDIWYLAGYPMLAAFAPDRYALVAENGSGSGSYPEGAVATISAEMPSVGYAFTGWTAEPAEYATSLGDAAAITTTFTMPTADVTLTATYVIKTYTVIFELGEHGIRTGGGELAQRVAHGADAVAPEFAVEDGSVFVGWDREFTTVTAGLTVTALYVVLDTDNDNLPDAWEYRCFGNLDQHRANDPDGDGFTNWEEFVIGTDPNDNQSYPRDRTALVWQDAVQKLRVIGLALERYMADHGPDVLPGRLMYLVDEGYLDADMLLAIGDESGGTNPFPQFHGDEFADTYENGVSFFYETSEAYCPFTVPGYVHTAESTWYDVKMYELLHSDGFYYPCCESPYDRRAFPIIGFMWATDNMATTYRYMTRINLAIDCRTVFASPMFSWEDVDAYLPDDPAALRPLPDDPIVAQYEVPLCIPLWFILKDVSSTYGLRLVPSDDAGDTGIIGEIRDLYYVVTPGIDTPTAFTVTVEWDDGTGTAQRASFAIALDSGPDDDPDGDGLSNATELAIGTDPYDSDSKLTVSFAEATMSVSETAGQTAIRCCLSQASPFPTTVVYSVVGGTARNGGVDYMLAASTLSFAPGVTIKDILVTLTDDKLSEGTETVRIRLAYPVNAVLGSQTTITLNIIDNDPHTVTFQPGLHGTLVGGDPAVVYTVADGAPVPSVPVVYAEVGWTHVGWEWTPGEYRGGPVSVALDMTATALYEETVPAPPAWGLDLALVGAEPVALTLGMRGDANDGWDAGIDSLHPLPSPGQACLALDDLGAFYSTDYRALADTAEFMLVASAAEDAALAISWNAARLPQGKYLSIYEVELSSRTTTWSLVGNTGRNMALTSSLEVPAGATRCYVIRYGDDLAFDLALQRGWNLVSLPIEPSDPSAQAVLSDGKPNGSDGRAAYRDIWTGQGSNYTSTTEIHACIGYWIYAAEATVLLVKGSPAEQTSLSLHRGWNMRGMETPRPVLKGNTIMGPVWGWDARLMSHKPATTMLPGYGYMINVVRDTKILLRSE